jgi:hypothetical protein
VGIFLTLTVPSRFHAVTTAKGSRVVLKNPKYDGSSPRDAQAWLCARWAEARSAMARAGIAMYGLRVAEAHHDGTPHWHALLWFENQAQAALARVVIRAKWLMHDGADAGASRYRVSIVAMKAGGAAGYVAKYIAKNINSSVDVGKHLDDLQGAQLELDTGAYQGAARVDAWAATWGIRQFQFVGLPPVGVWRAMRAVSVDQVKDARDVPREVRMACDAVHRSGDAKADHHLFIKAMGGVALGLKGYALRIGREVSDKVNSYGEAVRAALTVGVEDAAGRLYVSRRSAWARVVDAPAQSPEVRAALAAPWTRFNNCAARLRGGIVKSLFDRPLFDSFDITAMRWQAGMRCQR